MQTANFDEVRAELQKVNAEIDSVNSRMNDSKETNEDQKIILRELSNCLLRERVMLMRYIGNLHYSELAALELEKERAYKEKEEVVNKYAVDKIRILEAEVHYLQGKLQCRFILETCESKKKIYEPGKGKTRVQAWTDYLNNTANKECKDDLLQCFDSNANPSVNDVVQTIQGLFKRLNSEIHAPTVKIGKGKYCMPIPPDTNGIEKCFLHKIVRNMLGWNIDFTEDYDYDT